jgi:hypothetical protein
LPGDPRREPRREFVNVKRQLWRGEILSNGSLTPLSQGLGSAPMKLFSMFSVWPPEVEK